MRKGRGRGEAPSVHPERAGSSWLEPVSVWSREALERTGMRERRREIARSVGQVDQNKGRQQSRQPRTRR